MDAIFQPGTILLVLPDNVAALKGLSQSEYEFCDILNIYLCANNRQVM